MLDKCDLEAPKNLVLSLELRCLGCLKQSLQNIYLYQECCTKPLVVEKKRGNHKWEESFPLFGKRAVKYLQPVPPGVIGESIVQAKCARRRAFSLRVLGFPHKKYAKEAYGSRNLAFALETKESVNMKICRGVRTPRHEPV